MKRALVCTTLLIGAGLGAGGVLAPTASAVPPQSWHPCSDYFRDVTDGQAWDGRHQPVISPWGNSNIQCAFEWNDEVGGWVGWADAAYQIDPSGRPHAMYALPGSNTRIFITNPF
ncbi:hypothetical protein [Nocardia sp. NPDC050406]|uniref:hypothetical protein n=1 Tax=Nocardia sp. NPDC050406 TaxID=3364318 RepID=UPI0037B06699